MQPVVLAVVLEQMELQTLGVVEGQERLVHQHLELVDLVL